MPSALLKPCAVVGCGELVAAGRCPVHARQIERYRGSAASRGYDAHWSTVFRPWFFRALVAAGILPVCGAALPGGPSMAASQCRASGRLNAQHLHLDHDPPLRRRERVDRRVVEDPRRVGLLCRSCHARKTLQEQQAGVVG